MPIDGHTADDLVASLYWTRPADAPLAYLRLTPADQDFLTRKGIRWRY